MRASGCLAGRPGMGISLRSCWSVSAATTTPATPFAASRCCCTPCGGAPCTPPPCSRKRRRRRSWRQSQLQTRRRRSEGSRGAVLSGELAQGLGLELQAQHRWSTAGPGRARVWQRARGTGQGSATGLHRQRPMRHGWSDGRRREGMGGPICWLRCSPVGATQHQDTRRRGPHGARQGICVNTCASGKTSCLSTRTSRRTGSGAGGLRVVAPMGTKLGHCSGQRASPPPHRSAAAVVCCRWIVIRLPA